MQPAQDGYWLQLMRELGVLDLGRNTPHHLALGTGPLYGD
jgi:hypothetical protein